MEKIYRCFYKILAILTAAIFLTACSAVASDNTLLKEPIQVWLVQFEEREEGEQFFSELMANRFSVIHPEAEVIISSMTDEELLETFKADAQLGLGPDLLVGASIWVPELVEMGLIQDLSDRSDIDTSIYLSTAVSTLRYKPTDGGKEGLYGLPITLGSTILYYNKDFVDGPPPTTLSALLDRAAEGQNVALDTSFHGAFWGIPAYGGRLFDAEGRVALDEGGFAEWLSWLEAAQDQPGIEWTADRQEALELFIQNREAYLAGEKWMLSLLLRNLGAEKVGVAPLPAGPNGEAGPFLVVAGALLNPASDPAESTLALEFARYIASLESQTLLMKQANFVPANVNVDTTDHPAIGGFLEQARSAFVPPNDRVEQVLVMLYSDYNIYQEVLVNGQNPSEAVRGFWRRV